ncbi:hypothetical protein K2173_000210 [Erythroxylum novogranatense]|uniref:UspA domain-containing protein n=1 Tax=Erythroxylum novogranatense TaxID=1862640 RepID=A0AAV8SX46_9ROSI|nr:hypothetical protein K2173_000210 [Erythroxylum novogranatense]
MEGDKKVMVVLDECDCSFHTLIWILDNLKDLTSDWRLLIFTALPTPNCYHTIAAFLDGTAFPLPLPTYFLFLSNPGFVLTTQERDEEGSMGLLEKALKICASRGVKAETITELGESRELICEAVVDHKIDLLVIGGPATEGAFTRFFTGSLSDYCVQNAKCPVLVVNKPEYQDL